MDVEENKITEEITETKETTEADISEEKTSDNDTVESNDTEKVEVPSEKKKKGHKALAITLSLLFIGGLGLAGYMLKDKFIKSPAEPNTATETPAVTKEAKATVAPTEEPTLPPLKELPLPELSGGLRGELGIDKNINEEVIDEYLGRYDSVYRDMRMLEDPGNYEAIGGDRFLSGYVDGFEVIPLPYILPVSGLPGEVGDTYTGTTLFYDDNGTYVANYKESMDIIEEIFPKDKIIFLMCGGGGYAGMTKNFLISLGWDETKIYVVGGYWYYHGEHDVKVKKEVNGVVTYDFENVPYHNIDFDMLTKTSNYKAPYVKVSNMKLNTENTTIEEGNSFQLSCIILPNEATNKGVTWKSDNEEVATVTDTGLVKAIKRGYATITVKSDDCGLEKYVYVDIKRKKPTDKVKLDDISEEVKEFSDNDTTGIYADYYKIGYDDEGNPKEGYFIPLPDGGYASTELYDKETAAFDAKVETMHLNQINVFNKLVDDKKTFVLCVERYTDCGDSEDKVAKSAKKILNDNNIDCLFTTSDNYQLFENASIDIYDSSSIFVISNGKVHAAEDKSVDSMRDDEEITNWLKNYIIF